MKQFYYPTKNQGHRKRKMKVFPITVLALLLGTTACEIMPRNSLKDCRAQCKDTDKPNACYDFCACIHANCQPLDNCLATYDKAAKDTSRTP